VGFRRLSFRPLCADTDRVINHTCVMGYEGFTQWSENRGKSPEKKAVVIKTTDKVIRELRGHRNPEFLSADARRVLARIIRVNNRDKKAVLAGETKAMAVWINEIWFGYADVR
ncbi:MAG: hypothetical protein KGJ78_17790, partial [Alphaproteobacteria bacterium]|nr:hypothetical protein [Alphaproteobacteria bacterium]